MKSTITILRIKFSHIVVDTDIAMYFTNCDMYPGAYMDNKIDDSQSDRNSLDKDAKTYLLPSIVSMVADLQS